MRQSLNPTLLSRISRILRPDFIRTVLARRIAAAVLVILAAVAALRPDPDLERHNVVIASRDLRPGMPLTADDIRLESRAAESLPDGALRTLDPTLGATLSGPARRGEVLTDARVLSPRLVELTVGPDAQVVPLQLTDAAVVDLIRAGDVVDVLGAVTSDSEAKPRVLAHDAVVVLVSEKPQFASNQGRVVLLALPRAQAHSLAGATLVNNVTITIH